MQRKTKKRMDGDEEDAAPPSFSNRLYHSEYLVQKENSEEKVPAVPGDDFPGTEADAKGHFGATRFAHDFRFRSAYEHRLGEVSEICGAAQIFESALNHSA